MQRRKFIKTSCIACITGIAFAELLEGCHIAKHITAEIIESNLVIPIHHFYQNETEDGQFKKYLIVQNDKLKFPICVYRISEQNYSALWLECPHQGAELQVFGDVLQCPAHGSEFSNTGKVLSSPAAQDLKSFPIIIEKSQLKISLK